MLALVIIDEHDAVVQLIMGHKLECLPVLSFVQLPITDAYIDILIGDTRMLQPVCNTGRHAGTLPQRAAGHIDTGGQQAVHMARDPSADIIHCQQQLFIKESQLRQSGLHRRRGMALAHYQVVTPLRHGKAAADMPHPALLEHFQLVNAQLGRKLFQFSQLFCIHNIPPINKFSILRPHHVQSYAWYVADFPERISL